MTQLADAKARYRAALTQLTGSHHATPAARQEYATELRQACQNLLQTAQAHGAEQEARTILAADWAGLESEGVIAEMLRLAAPVR